MDMEERASDDDSTMDNCDSRMIEQSLQLRLIAKDTGARDNAYAELVKSLKMTDREFVQRMLEEFEQTERSE